jgi:hypothetical protein
MGSGAMSGSSMMSAMMPVTYFDQNQVTAAFAKGVVLLDGTGRNYMVHASRREAAGQAEVHDKDTDIIYVLDGTATFVTGGAVVDGKTTAPDELRGASVRGGHPALVPTGHQSLHLVRGEGALGRWRRSHETTSDSRRSALGGR